MVEKSVDREVHGLKSKEMSGFSPILVKGFSDLEAPQSFISSYSVLSAMGTRKWKAN
jgi:hypothetical protein